MSGLFGLVNFDEQPPGLDFLERVKRSLQFRGPDGADLWFSNRVGMVHTLLRTTDAAVRERQPADLDGRLRLVADVRLDARETLVSKLRVGGADVRDNTPDPELLLHGYEIWGEGLLDHLYGDFSFALWDVRRQRLFCARDHFGVKPFFYAETPSHFLFSNTLACIRDGPDIDDALNDQAIADMLLFGHFLDLDVTAFERILRLPPAHTLTLQGRQAVVRRYWEPDATRRIRYRKRERYIEHFIDVFERSVADRLPPGNTAISLSGGLDSTAISAVARRVANQTSRSERLFAVTVEYSRLFSCPEGRFAGTVAKSLNIPHRFFNADRYELFKSLDGGIRHNATPEPYENPFLAGALAFLSDCAADTRVLLQGKGGDELLLPECIPSLAARVPWRELLEETMRTLVFARKRPALCIRQGLRNLFGRDVKGANLPPWLVPELVERLRLRERQQRHGRQRERYSRHKRPGAVAALMGAFGLVNFLESMDPGVTGVSIEARWPFLDRRLVDDLLAFPPVYWFAKKQLLREAMRGLLPRDILTRPKTTLVASPTAMLLQRPESAWIDSFRSAPELARYVERSFLPALAGGNSTWQQLESPLRVLSLNMWLEQNKIG